MNVFDILAIGTAHKASDIHIVPGCPPLFRIDGYLVPLNKQPFLTAKECEDVILHLLTVEQRERLTKENGLDFSITSGDMRYRGNVSFQRNGIEMVLRVIPLTIPSPEALLLPPIITKVTRIRSGLVLVTGPTGAGKSTTLACMIDLINRTRRGHIVTIEDPIEFLFTNLNCVVSQREIGVHAPSFSVALRAVMRQDPDVVMIGEMRDLETIAAAITLAETGNLVFATLHSNDAVQAIDRIIDVFPARQQQQIRTQVASVLRAVIAQTLVPKANDKGRVALREVIIVNSAIANLVRQGKNHEIYSTIEMGTQEGMISAARALEELVRNGLVNPDDVSLPQ